MLGLRRLCSFGLALSVGVLTFAVPAHADGPLSPLLLVLEDSLPAATEKASVSELPFIRSSELHKDARAPSGEAVRWLTVSGAPILEGSRPPAGGLRLSPARVGTYRLPLQSGERSVNVVELWVQRSGQKVDPHQGWVGLSRELPQELSSGDLRPADKEAFEVVVFGPVDALPSSLDVTTQDESGEFVDSLRALGLVSSACPSWIKAEIGFGCGSTGMLRLGADVVERSHPAVVARSLRAVVGGEAFVSIDSYAGVRVRVGGPSGLQPQGPGRYRMKLRARLVRTFAGGPAPLGGSDAEAVSLVRQEIMAAARMWGKCGLTVGPQEELDVAVVDPPLPSHLTVGCGRALPASGGEMTLNVDGKTVRVRLAAGQTPESAAGALAAILRSRGYQTRVFKNAITGGAALSSFDVMVGHASGKRVLLGPLSGQRVSSDPHLTVCSEPLDLAGGLEHFHDDDAAAGTLQERLVLRALMDDDPSSIDLIVVPVFGGVGRIGESFIFDYGSSIQNALILDRTGIRAGSRSFTLAHELGHILLDLPGHPDDFGVDTPSSLMDADAADPTIFGPRRLGLDDCQRMLRQSGSGAPVPLIFEYPLHQGE